MPFVQSAVGQLFDLLEARLAGITTANGYPIDITAIHRGRLEPPSHDELPYLNFWATGLQREGQGIAAGSGTRADYSQNSRQLLVTIAISDRVPTGISFVDRAATLSDCVETAINRDAAAPDVDDDALTYIPPVSDVRLDRIAYFVSTASEPYVTTELEILMIHRTVNGRPYELESMF